VYISSPLVKLAFLSTEIPAVENPLLAAVEKHTHLNIRRARVYSTLIIPLSAGELCEQRDLAVSMVLVSVPTRIMQLLCNATNFLLLCGLPG